MDELDTLQMVEARVQPGAIAANELLDQFPVLGESGPIRHVGQSKRLGLGGIDSRLVADDLCRRGAIQMDCIEPRRLLFLIEGSVEEPESVVEHLKSEVVLRSAIVAEYDDSQGSLFVGLDLRVVQEVDLLFPIDGNQRSPSGLVEDDGHRVGTA